MIMLPSATQCDVHEDVNAVVKEAVELGLVGMQPPGRADRDAGWTQRSQTPH